MCPRLIHYGPKEIVPVNNKIIVIIQNIMKDEDRINEIIGMIFFSGCLTIPATHNIIPAHVRKNVT